MKLFIFIISILLTFSCSDEVSQRDKAIYEKEEIIALNDVFINLFGEYLRDGYRAGPPPKPLPPNANKEDSIRFGKELEYRTLKFEEKKRGIIDTSYFKSMNLYVSDTLVKFTEDIDIDFSKTKLLDHAINTPRKFNLNDLQSVNAFEIKNLTKIKDKRRRINELHFIFSRMLFNKDYSLGYFSYDSFQYGAVVSIEKVNSKWVIKDRKQTWVE